MIKEKSKGFTLIELLIVISILALLIGIVILLINPTNTLNRARTAAVKSYTVKACGAIQVCNVNSATGACVDANAASGTAPSPVVKGAVSSSSIAANIPLISSPATTCDITCDTASGQLTVGANCVD